jgi:hypothetical protein
MKTERGQPDTLGTRWVMLNPCNIKTKSGVSGAPGLRACSPDRGHVTPGRGGSFLFQLKNLTHSTQLRQPKEIRGLGCVAPVAGVSGCAATVCDRYQRPKQSQPRPWHHSAGAAALAISVVLRTDR